MGRRYLILAGSLLAACALALGGCSGDPEQSLDKAMSLRVKGDNAAAALELRSALSDHPRNHELLFVAGEVLADLGELADAELLLRRSIEYGHPAADVRPVLARVLLDLERYSEALRVLKAQSQPESAKESRLALLRGRAQLGLGALSEAQAEFSLSQNMQPSAAAKLGLARVAMAEKDRLTSARLIAEVLGSDPKNLDALVLRAEEQQMDGRLDESAATYREAISLHQHGASALVGLATLELTRDRIEEALPPLKQAEKLAPQSPRTRFAKALLAYKQKRNGAAVAELQLILRAVPNDAQSLLLLGAAQYADGKYEQAQTALAEYLQRSPGDSTALRTLGATLLAKGQPHLVVNVLAPHVASTQDVGVLAIAAEAHRQMRQFKQARALLQRAIKLAPENADLITSLALTDLESGAREQVLAGLEKAIARRPPDTRADEALIMVLLGQKQFDRAAKVASALAQRLPESSSTYVLQGAVLLAKKDWAGAREGLERALQIDPTNLHAVEALADVDAAEGKPDGRRERLEAILKKDPRHLGALLALAQLDLAQGRQAQGIAAIRRALAEHPHSGNALLMLADTQFRHGEVEEAIVSARQAYQLHPFDARAIAVLGEAQMAAGDKQGAILTLSKLHKLHPEDVASYLRLAAAYLRAGDNKAAAATALRALAKAPQDLGALAMLADIYLQAGDLERAQALGSRTQREQPTAALGYRIEGDVLLGRKEYAHALDVYKKAAALQTTGALLVKMHQAQNAGRPGSADDNALRAWIAKNPDDVDTRFYLADAMSRGGRYREASDEYLQVLKRLPNSARALNNLAWALHASGDKRALQYAKQAVVLFPSSAAAVDTLGWILLEQGSLNESVAALLKAVSLDGDNPEIRYHLIQALLKAGDDRQAKAELDMLLRINKPFPQLPEARALALRLGL